MTDMYGEKNMYIWPDYKQLTSVTMSQLAFIN